MNNKKTKPRVVFVGINILAENILNKLSQFVDVIFFQNYKESSDNFKGVKLIPSRYGSLGFNFFINKFKMEVAPPLFLPGFRKKIGLTKPDILVIFDFYRLYFFQALKYKRKNKDVRLCLYSETKKKPNNVFARMVFNFFLNILYKNIDYIDNIFVGSSKVEVIPAPIDTSLFYPDPRKEFMKGGYINILVNSRYVEYKRHDDILQAISKILNSGVRCKVTFIGRTGHLEKDIVQRVSRLGLEKVVTFRDPVQSKEDLRELYLSHDLSILASRDEAIGMVVPESLACGIPTITSDTVGANVYVDKEKTDLIFKTGDFEDLAEKIIGVNDPEILKEISQISVDYIKNNFTPNKVVEKILNEIIE
jgi:glycosyltransferase involved in cell wall biosynthesis